jgi:hypothetical protein
LPQQSDCAGTTTPRRRVTSYGDGDADSDADGLSELIGLAEAAGLSDAGAELGTDRLGVGDVPGVHATSPTTRQPARRMRLITVAPLPWFMAGSLPAVTRG